MRRFAQLNPSNIVTGLISMESPSAAFLADITNIEVTSRVDGPWDGKLYTRGTDTFSVVAIPPDTITPLITKAQAATTLGTLLSLNPTAWTATQERQAMYLILLFCFKDFKTGKVY